jgi:hypothetical protein
MQIARCIHPRERASSPLAAPRGRARMPQGVRPAVRALDTSAAKAAYLKSP